MYISFVKKIGGLYNTCKYVQCTQDNAILFAKKINLKKKSILKYVNIRTCDK